MTVESFNESMRFLRDCMFASEERVAAVGPYQVFDDSFKYKDVVWLNESVERIPPQSKLLYYKGSLSYGIKNWLSATTDKSVPVVNGLDCVDLTDFIAKFNYGKNTPDFLLYAFAAPTLLSYRRMGENIDIESRILYAMKRNTMYSHIPEDATRREQVKYLDEFVRLRLLIFASHIGKNDYSAILREASTYGITEITAPMCAYAKSKPELAQFRCRGTTLLNPMSDYFYDLGFMSGLNTDLLHSETLLAEWMTDDYKICGDDATQVVLATYAKCANL